MDLPTLQEISSRASDTPRSESSQNIPLDADWMTSFFGFTDSGDNSIFRNTSSNREKFAIISEMLRKSAVYYPETGKLYTVKGKYEAGWFVHPTVKEIRDMVNVLPAGGGRANIDVIQGKDVGMAHVEAGPLETFQGASQFNALEMMDPDETPFDGIEKYIQDQTQGPRTALIAALGTYIRNYWVLKEYGSQFNALEKLGLSTLNGYLIWGTSPQSVQYKITSMTDKIMIPCMIYTQVAGITLRGGTITRHVMDKRMHQIYASGVPVNKYRNGGDNNTQLALAKAILKAEYVGTIGMGIVLHAIDKNAGRVSYLSPKINLTLVGGSAFGIPLDTVLDALQEAIAEFPNRTFDLNIHAYRADEAAKVMSKFPTQIYAQAPAQILAQVPAPSPVFAPAQVPTRPGLTFALPGQSGYVAPPSVAPSPAPFAALAQVPTQIPVPSPTRPGLTFAVPSPAPAAPAARFAPFVPGAAPLVGDPRLILGSRRGDAPLTDQEMLAARPYINLGIPLNQITSTTFRPQKINYRGEGRDIDVSKFLFTEGRGAIYEPRNYQKDMLHLLKATNDNFVGFIGYDNNMNRVDADVFRAIRIDGKAFLYGFIDSAGQIKWFIDENTLPTGYRVESAYPSGYRMVDNMGQIVDRWPLDNIQNYRVVVF